MTITKFARVTDIDYRNHITREVKQRIMMHLTLNQSETDIGKILGVYDWTIGRVITRINQDFQPNYQRLPCHLAFDDFKSERFAPSGMSMILMNIENKWTLDIIYSRRNSYPRNHFLRFDRQARLAVQSITVNLYTPYRKLIHELFPNAIIIADHVHVVAQAYRTLNQVRIQVMNQAGKGIHQWRTLKRFWKLLMTPAAELRYDNYWSRRNSSYTQLTDIKVIHRLLAFDNKLKQAYQDLVLAINQRDPTALDQLLVLKLTQLPQPLQRFNKLYQPTN